MNTPVKFEIAKLLKEKGFDNESAHYYNEKGEMLFDAYYPSLQPTKPDVYYDNPTIAEVIMWCFNKYRYSIEYSMNIPESGEYDGCYVFNGLIKGSEDYKLKVFYTSKDYPTIEKALEDTIHYFLVNFC